MGLTKKEVLIRAKGSRILSFINPTTRKHPSAEHFFCSAGVSAFRAVRTSLPFRLPDPDLGGV